MKGEKSIVEIVWFDAQSSLETIELKDLEKSKYKPVLTKSIGYLIKEKEEYIVLAFVDFGNGHYKHWQVIPLGMIQTRKVLRK